MSRYRPGWLVCTQWSVAVG